LADLAASSIDQDQPEKPEIASITPDKKDAVRWPCRALWARIDPDQGIFLGIGKQ
jgi:hypothetical protein